MAQMVTRDENSLRLQLKPPTLGEVNLELTVKDGVVKATILTDSTAAKEMLENGLDTLKQHLTIQGLQVEQMEILVNPDAMRQQAQAQDQQDFGGRQPAVGGGSEGGDDAAAVDGVDSRRRRVGRPVRQQRAHQRVCLKGGPHGHQPHLYRLDLRFHHRHQQRQRQCVHHQ